MKWKKDHSEYKHYIYMSCNCNSPYDNCYTENNIKICPQWQGKDGFWTFLKEVGTKPSEKHKLFRKDLKKGYNKDNCIWSITNPNIIKQEQCLKREPIVYKNKSYKTFTEFCRAFDIPYRRSCSRKREGWCLEDIINEPNQKENPTRRHLNKFFEIY